MTARRDTSADSAARPRFVGVRAPGASKRTTSAQTAAAFRESYEARQLEEELRKRGARMQRRPCCARYAFGDGTHDLICPRAGDPPCDDPPLSDRGVP